MKLNRDEIINKTLAYATVNGWENTSVRDISKEIRYSTIKIYSEFGGKEGLLREIQQKGFSILRSSYIKAIAKYDDPKDQMVSLCLAHWDFAKNNLRYYELMFTISQDMCKSVGADVLAYAAAPVKEVLKKITYSEDIIHFYHWFSLIHGFTIINLKNFESVDPKAEKTLSDIIALFIKGIQ